MGASAHKGYFHDMREDGGGRERWRKVYIRLNEGILTHYERKGGMEREGDPDRNTRE